MKKSVLLTERAAGTGVCGAMRQPCKDATKASRRSQADRKPWW